MKERIILNYRLLDWITITIKDIIEATIEDDPQSMEAFMLVNNMLNSIENLSTIRLADYVSEPLTEKMFDEIKNCI
ncbi:MAG: hypothetical protein Q4E75_06605 [bacterium]|nr:hypothetical protein [bacterium]